VDGQASRGSGAITSLADIIVEMHRVVPAANASAIGASRRRRLLAFSRLDRTPGCLVMQLTRDGADYEYLGDDPGNEFDSNWMVLRLVLEEAEDKLTRAEMLAQWPTDFAAPKSTTLYQWLAVGVKKNLICQEGTGRRGDPFRYWLPYVAETWRAKDPAGYDIAQSLRAPARRYWDEKDKKYKEKHGEDGEPVRPR
jgi:hypothetical protein